jgi:glutamine synthetase
MIGKAQTVEARRFLEQNPDIRAVDLLIADLNGIYRGKRVYPDTLEHVYEDGVQLAKSLFASDITGATSEYAGSGLQTGDMDCVCLPLPDTLYRIPWKARPTAQLQMVMREPGGEPYGGDPQSIVDGIVGRFSEMGLTPVVAIELEFYLIDRERDPNNEPQRALSPVTGRRQSATQVYSIADLDDYSNFIDDVMEATRVQNIPGDVAVAEYAPGQYEINLHHQADAQSACRHGLWLKRLIKGVAEKHRFNATFMPKPFRGLAGNGTHVHVSLIDAEVSNVFAPGGIDNKLLRNAIAGLLVTMPEAMLVLAPGANSYRRFAPGMYVPMTPNWGFNNRTVAVRVPAGGPTSTRIEHRVAGADANPYLLTACVLAGMHYGIANELEPPAVSTGDTCGDGLVPGLPDSWPKAIDSFESAKILPEYLGNAFCNLFITTKRQEAELFAVETTPLEYEWYLRNS